MLSIKYTPPRRRFGDETLSATNFSNSCSVTLAPGFFTMKARGSSPAISSGSPITAASSTLGCVKSKASNSAGAT